MTEPIAPVVRFATDVHSLEAIKRAAYTLMARATVTIEPSSDGIQCTIESLAEEGYDDLVRDFRREVLDQDLRIEAETKTEPLRNMILGLAFSRVMPGA